MAFTGTWTEDGESALGFETPRASQEISKCTVVLSVLLTWCPTHVVQTEGLARGRAEAGVLGGEAAQRACEAGPARRMLGR